MKYAIEKRTTVKYVVTGQREGDSLKTPIAECNTEAIALTVKRFYEAAERRDAYQATLTD